MSLWTERILSHFTADLTRLWVACDPEDVLLDEKLLTELRGRGFELMLYEDPFTFRAEYEERYRAAWDRGEQGPAPSLVLHLRSADANALPWDIVHHGRVVRLSLADLFPKLSYSAVQQVEPEHLAGLFHAHQTELQSARGESESKDFILEHVYQLAPRSIRTPVDFWRELLRMHFANRSLPPLFAQHAAGIIQGKGLFTDLPVATWLASKSALLRVVQDAWYRYHIYLTADHGNVESTGVGRPNQGVIAETRGERVRVYRSEPLLADSAAAYPTTVRLDIAGLPANFMPLFAGGRTAFVPEGEQVVVHGGVSIEELIVPFVKVSYVIGTE